MKNGEAKNLNFMQIEIHNVIMDHLPENRKAKWIKEIMPDEMEDILRSKRFIALSQLDIEGSSQEDFE